MRCVTTSHMTLWKDDQIDWSALRNHPCMQEIRTQNIIQQLLIQNKTYLYLHRTFTLSAFLFFQELILQEQSGLHVALGKHGA